MFVFEKERQDKEGRGRRWGGIEGDREREIDRRERDERERDR